MKKLSDYINEAKQMRSEKQKIFLKEALDDVEHLTTEDHETSILFIYKEKNYIAEVKLMVYFQDNGYQVEKSPDTLSFGELMLYLANWYLDTMETYP